MSILITNEEYRQDSYALLNQYKESMSYLASVFNDDYQKSDSVTKLSWKSFAFYNKCIKSLQANDADSGLHFFKKPSKTKGMDQKDSGFPGSLKTTEKKKSTWLPMKYEKRRLAKSVLVSSALMLLR
ncbi:hypothetical protein THH46_00480 [Pseudomonas sp. NA13]